MFDFFKKFRKKENATPSASSSPPAAAAPPDVGEVIIRTMPAKFLVAPRPPFWTAGKLWIGVAVLMVGLIGAVYWVVTSPQFQPRPSAPATAKTGGPTGAANQGKPSASPGVTNVNGPGVNAPAPLQPLTNAPPAPLFVPPASPPPSPTAPAAEPPVVLPASADTDADGLTDVEETLWHTDRLKPDTDGDGYPDGLELKNGYNPTGPGRLADSTLVKTYTHALYTALYPAAWTLTQSTDDSEAEFVSSSSEIFVSVSVQSHPREQSLSDWYASVAPGANAASLATETVGRHYGLFSPDRLTFYFIPPEHPDDVIVVTNHVGTPKTVDYPGTFAAIIANLSVKP